MNLQNISIEPGADGFRITDNDHEIPDRSELRAQYETSEGWQTIDFVFRREPATLLHPLRRSMFIYTGKTPSRIVVTAPGENIAGSAPSLINRNLFNRSSFYGQRNFNSWPDYNNNAWDDDYLSYFLGMHFHDSMLSNDFLTTQQQQGSTGGDVAAGDWGSSSQPAASGDAAPVAAREIAAAAANAAIESTGLALGGGAEIFAPASSESSAGPAEAPDPPASDPNAY